MTPEQLLRKRYLILINVPSESKGVNKGNVIIEHPEGGWVSVAHDTDSFRHRFNPEHYPETFYPLPWWTLRFVEDLPKYIRFERLGVISGEECVSWSIDDVNGTGRANAEIKGKGTLMLSPGNEFCDNFIPITEAEYNELKSRH